MGCLSTLSYGEKETDVQQVNGLVLLPTLSFLPAVESQGIFSIIYSTDSLPSSTSAESRYLQLNSSQYGALWSTAMAVSSLCAVPTTGRIVPLVDSRLSWQVSIPRKASEGTFKCSRLPLSNQIDLTYKQGKQLSVCHNLRALQRPLGQKCPSYSLMSDHRIMSL